VATTETRQTRVRQTRQESRERIVAAATELVRSRSYIELNVELVMAHAGLGRTIFYRHFDDLADLLVRAGREAIDELYAAQRALGEARPDQDPDAVRHAMEIAAGVYERHGPLLRAVAEAASGDRQLANDYEAMRRRFDDFVARSLADMRHLADMPRSELAETARALNLLNENYLLDAFGREPRVSAATAARTLTEIWEAVIHR
jgi:AcrR family transcriptional regulator